MASDTTEQNAPSTAYVDPAAISLYINDLIVGMLETGRTRVEIRRGHRFPFYGCYTGTVMRVAYRQLVNRLKAMTETMQMAPVAASTEGYFVVIIGPEGQAQHIRFNVAVEPMDAAVCLSFEPVKSAQS